MRLRKLRSSKIISGATCVVVAVAGVHRSLFSSLSVASPHSFDVQVVEKADVVLEVLDARDPLGSRAEAVEDAVLSRAGKKLVLVLNKVGVYPNRD